MKGKLLLLAGLLPLTGLFAQSATRVNNNVKAAVMNTERPTDNAKTKGAPSGHARTHAVLATETFGTGGPGVLPAGWSVGGAPTGVNGNWKWIKSASGKRFGSVPGALRSTTGAGATTPAGNDGWMIYDSDSVGDVSTANNLAGYMQSPSYNFSNSQYISLNFQEYFRVFLDSIYLEVSNNNGATWNRFPIRINQPLRANDFAPGGNPTNVSVDISSAAGNQSNVKVRFWYNFTPGSNPNSAKGGYSYHIDDLQFVELDTADVSIQRSVIYGPWGDADITGGSSLYNMPLSLVDSVSPLIFLSNDGAFRRNATKVTSYVYLNNNRIYADSINYTTLPAGSFDSLLQFRYFKPTQVGVYTAVFNASTAGEVNTSRNSDTNYFSVTDDIWSQNNIPANGRTFVHLPASLSGNGFATSSSRGTRFDVPTGKSDTVKGFSVAFHSSTTVGSRVGVQIYKAGPNSWEIMFNSKPRILSASDISIPGTPIYANFEIDSASFTTPTPLDALLLTEGSYAVVVVPMGVDTGATVALLSSTSSASVYAGLFGYFGQSDTSNNTFTGNPDFGATFATGTKDIPFVRMNFGPFSAMSNVGNTASVKSLPVFPNPASDKLYLPAVAGKVSVEITNGLGQVVSSQSLLKSDNAPVEVSVRTLPNGTYHYNMQTASGRFAGKFVVMH